MEVVDKTGQPRSDEELEEAINVINEMAVKSIMDLPPKLGVNLMNIRALLLELRSIRKLIAESRSRRGKEPG